MIEKPIRDRLEIEPGFLTDDPPEPTARAAEIVEGEDRYLISDRPRSERQLRLLDFFRPTL